MSLKVCHCIVIKIIMNYRMTDTIKYCFLFTEFFINAALSLLYRFVFHGSYHIRSYGILVRHVKIHRHAIRLERTSCRGYRHLCKPDAVSLFKRFLDCSRYLRDLLYILDLSVYHRAL